MAHWIPEDTLVQFPLLAATTSDSFTSHLSKGCSGKGLSSGGVIFDRDEHIHLGILRIGFGDRQYNPDMKSSILIQGKIVIHGCGIHAFATGTKISIGSNGTLEIGDRFTASANNRIYCYHHIIIEEDNMWSFDNVIMDTDMHQILSEAGDVINHCQPVVFRDHVWLGCRNIILKGSVISHGCIVAAGSLISGKLVCENSIVTSNKKIIKQEVNWNRNLVK